MERVISWKSPKVILTLLLSMVALVGLLTLAQRVNSPVSFEDPNLEAAIREKLGRPTQPLRRSEVLSVIRLDASGWDIHSLEGIQALRRLTKLTLADNAIEDLRPLAKLNMLTALDLSNNHISSLDDIHINQIHHLRLRELKLRSNAIQNITPLIGFTSLEKLNLRDNLVSDLTPLKAIPSLTYLNIHSNPVEQGLDALGTLTGLDTLIMRNVSIGDNYAFLEPLVQLNRLNIRNTQITDLSIIASLMQAGALQDKPEVGIAATVDLLQINPDDTHGDPYGVIRRYWDNISLRYPLSLPFYHSQISPPQFSHESGFFDEAFPLTITADDPTASIFYTLDGSEPAFSPLLEPMGNTYKYNQPIDIEKLSLSDNSIANIKTSVSEGSPHKDLSHLFIGNVVRAIVITSTGERSNVSTRSYFIGENIHDKYSIPVVSIAVNPNHFFDDEIGIYIPGNHFEDLHPEAPWWNPANYSQRGLKWERPIAFEMFSPTGELLISQSMGIRIHGGATRSHAQKSLRLLPGPSYDEQELIQYSFFPALDNRFNDAVVDSFTSLILRNSGNDWVNSERWRSTMFRDALSQSLLEPTTLDIQGVQPVIVFINGEYWGVQNVRTRFDQHYYFSYHDVEPQDLVVLDNWVGQVYIGDAYDGESFVNILRLIDPNFRENGYQTANTLADQYIYEEVKNLIDIENYINFQVAHIYFNNTDWPHNNVRFWHSKTSSSTSANDRNDRGSNHKWRWMFMDADKGFAEPENNTLVFATNGSEYKFSTFLTRALLENEEFKTQFINAFADHLNTSFREEVVISRIDAFEDIYSPEITDQINRWGNLGGSKEAWIKNVESLREFARLRPTYIRQHIVDYFNLPGLANLTLQTQPDQGYVRINSVALHTNTIGVKNPGNWQGVYFQGVPIEIEAVPHKGYHFVRWEGLNTNTIIGGSTLIQIKLEDDLSMKAVFEAD